MHFRLQHYHIDFEFYLSCKFIKSMVCPMMWILTSEESVELALDGINIPHGQWTSNIIIFYCPSKYVVTLVVISIVSIILMNLMLNNIYGFPIY